MPGCSCGRIDLSLARSQLLSVFPHATPGRGPARSLCWGLKTEFAQNSLPVRRCQKLQKAASEILVLRSRHHDTRLFDGGIAVVRQQEAITTASHGAGQSQRIGNEGYISISGLGSLGGLRN